MRLSFLIGMDSAYRRAVELSLSWLKTDDYLRNQAGVS
jgi:hypothetical protein